MTDIERRTPVAHEQTPARVEVRAQLRRTRDEMAEPRDYSRNRPHMFPEVTR